MAFLDYYEILSVPPTATLEQIERAYKRLVSISHPDLFGSDAHSQAWATERMKQINEAHDVLTDPERRAAHDRVHAEHHRNRQQDQREQEAQQHRRERRQQYRETRYPCPLCEQEGHIPCPVCAGRGDEDCSGCYGEQVVSCPICLGVGTLPERKYREYVAAEQRAREQAQAQAARQKAEAAERQRAQEARLAAEGRRRVVLAGVGVVCLLFVARSCSGGSQRPVAYSTVQAPDVVQPTPYQPFVTPAPERTRPPATPSLPSLRSKQSLTPTHVTFRNEISKPVEVLWIDYEGHEVPYRTLGPGESYVQQTFATHPWRVRDATTGRSLRTMVAGPKPSTVVVKEPQQAPPVAAPTATRAPSTTAPTPAASGDESVQPGAEPNRGSPSATPAVPSGPTVRSLNELSPILQLQTEFRSGGALFGQQYQFAVVHANRSGLIVRTAYHLNGEYSRFEAMVGMQGSGNLLQLAAAKVYGDGELLFESPTLGFNQPPVRVSVSVKGVTRLELQTTGLPIVWTVIWADPKLIKD